MSAHDTDALDTEATHDRDRRAENTVEDTIDGAMRHVTRWMAFLGFALFAVGVGLVIHHDIAPLVQDDLLALDLSSHTHWILLTGICVLGAIPSARILTAFIQYSRARLVVHAIVAAIVFAELVIPVITGS